MMQMIRFVFREICGKLCRIQQENEPAAKNVCFTWQAGTLEYLTHHLTKCTAQSQLQLALSTSPNEFCKSLKDQHGPQQ